MTVAFTAVLAAGLIGAVLPGYLTDPSAGGLNEPVEGIYRPPENLQFPYVSTYYVKPVVTTEDDVRIRFYVTDYDQSEVRLLDTSHKFAVQAEYGLDGEEGVRTKPLPFKAGDGELSLGRLAVGDYWVQIWATDAKRRESHRVLHRFRVIRRGSNVPTDKETYRMTEADLTAYGLRNDGDFHRFVPEGGDTGKPGKRPGYAIVAKVDENGRPVVHSYKTAQIVYDESYDAAAVEREGVANVKGLQRLLDEKAAAGVRKIVLLPGCYRFSAAETLFMRNGLTVDMNGAVFKLNRFTGAKSLMVDFRNCHDAHLTNGTLDGDYWEHDYAGSPDGSEWPMGFRLTGATSYSTVSKVTVRNITGYGIGTGINDVKDGHTDAGLGLGKLAPGGLDPRTGEVRPKDEGRFTTDFSKIGEKLRSVGSFSISKYLGYQGRATRAWQFVVCWYDDKKRFLFAQTGWQYRQIHVPAKAAYCRVSFDLGKAMTLKETELCATHFRVPYNCVIAGCTVDRARCVGIAPCAMINLLFKGNTIVNSGEAKARCAFDAEDGWDMMIDTTLVGNVLKDNYFNNELLTCAGHNFVFERNTCDFYLYGRTNSSCVRDNDVGKAVFYGEGRLRTGYGRFSGNRITKSLCLGINKKPVNDGWRITLSGLDFDGTRDKVPSISVLPGGQLINCSFANMSVKPANMFNCSLVNCTAKQMPALRWKGVRVRGCKFSGLWARNEFVRCRFEDTAVDEIVRGGNSTWTDCDLENLRVNRIGDGNLNFVDCRISKNSYVKGAYWEKPANLFCDRCAIDVGEKPFCDVGAYTLRNFRFEGCTVTGKGELLALADLRPQPTDNLPATIAISNCTISVAASPAVAVKWRADSAKPVTVTGANNKPTGARLIDVKSFPKKWRVDVR